MIDTQRRVISEFAEKKGWQVLRWYEEPEQNAKCEELEARPAFAQLLQDAETRQFQVVLCSASTRWSRTSLVWVSLLRLRKVGVWWATADGLWDLDKVQQNGITSVYVLDTIQNEKYIRQLSQRTRGRPNSRPYAGEVDLSPSISKVSTF
jgi:DNA invertase Pin-like site-specific DNA recombinase